MIIPMINPIMLKMIINDTSSADPSIANQPEVFTNGFDFCPPEYGVLVGVTGGGPDPAAVSIVVSELEQDEEF